MGSPHLPFIISYEYRVLKSKPIVELVVLPLSNKKKLEKDLASTPTPLPIGIAKPTLGFKKHPTSWYLTLTKKVTMISCVSKNNNLYVVLYPKIPIMCQATKSNMKNKIKTESDRSRFIAFVFLKTPVLFCSIQLFKSNEMVGNRNINWV